MDQVWQALKNYIGPLLIGLVVLALLVGLGISLEQLLKMGGTHLDPTIVSLPLIAIGGVIVLMLVLCLVALAFSILGLADKDQAMGLPEGSIRAVIALSLIVLFAILSVFLYQSLITGGSINTVDNLSETARAEFLRDHSTARDLQSVLVKGPDGQPVKAADGSSLYRVTYRSENSTSDDFAKQLLVLLGTLMTAITSFYLGAGTATSAASAVQAATSMLPSTNTPPTVSSINPIQHTVSTQGYLIHLEVLGNNLNIITHVKLVRAGAQVVGQNVSSNPTRVSCDVDLSSLASPQGTPWDVVVDDGGANSATLRAALTIFS